MTKFEQSVDMPEAAARVLKTLEQAGWEAWLVGGCVRDTLLGRPVKDYDIATNAPPEKVQGLFSVVIPTGVAFGGVTVVEEAMRLEVTTYRTDQGYSDGRHPDAVRFGATVQEDAARRDFTIGALYWSPAYGVYDPTGQGLSDLAAGVIRAVGDPRRRFTEDALRVLRAVRFSAQLSFAIEEDTLRALTQCAPGLAQVSRERITGELLKILTSPRPQAMKLLDESGALEELLDSRLRPAEQRDYTLPARVPAGEAVRLAAFCLGVGAPMAVVERSLRLPKALCREVRDILTCCSHGPSNDPLWLKSRLAKYRQETVLDALHLWQGFTGQDCAAARQTLSGILRRVEPCRVEHLMINGGDLLALGVPPMEIGSCLGAFAVLVMENPELNNREFLLGEVAEICSCNKQPD